MKIVETAKAANVYAAALYDFPVTGQSSALATFAIPTNEDLSVSQARATSWALSNLAREQPTRLYSSNHVEPPLGFTNMQVRQLSDGENPAVAMLNRYIQEQDSMF